MEKFVVNEKEIEIPTMWEDVTYERFMDFSKLIEGFKKTKEATEDDEVAQWENTLTDLKNNTRVLSFWSGLAESDISMLDLEVAADMMRQFGFISEAYTPINIASFKINDEEFILPEDLMRQSSFGRYIESEQLEMQANLLEKGQMDVLPRQIAILCKKEGEVEKLDDVLIDKRAKMFEKLDMATIWDVGFFLGKLEQRLMLSFLTYQEAKLQTLKQR
jgi:hypothetical protein